jgi:class 3 adenylate cyclase/TolB-like protein/Tfp pilus assembly protein PilF
MAQRKKIVAIMFTGLANYSQLVKKDKKLALEILTEHDKILSKIIKANYGNIIKHINEAIFIEYPSATDATGCALQIQDKLKKFNATSPKDFQINIGIGIHMAEVYEEDGDLFGDGINLAARMKSVAAANEIFTTQAVYNSIRSEKNIYVKDIGRVVLKNIKDPERIFKIYNNKVDFESEPLDILINQMKERGVDFFDYKKSSNQNTKVAMHYINNLGSPDDEFFCYGITDTINIELNKIKSISAPASANILKIKDLESPNKIGKSLNVDYVLQGSLMKMGNQFRLSVNMTNIINSNELWSEHWEENSDNLSQVKNEIIIKILDSLGIKVPNELKKQAEKEQSIDPHAYELLMKAKYAYINASNAGDLDIAAALFKQAYEIQPEYITARNFYAVIQFRLKKTDEAISILEEAENIGKQNKDDIGLANIYETFGQIYKQMGKYSKAVNYLKEGLRIATNKEILSREANILNTLGQCYTNMSQFEHASDYLKRSISIKRQIDRPAQEIANSVGNLANVHKRIGDYAKAMSLLEESIEIAREHSQIQLGRTIMMYANLLYYIGKTDQAHEQYLESLDLCKKFKDTAALGMIYRHLGLIELNNENPEKSIKYLMQANQTHQDSKQQIAIDTTTLFLAQAHLQNNDLDNASKYIGQAVMLTNRRRHADKTQSFDEYYTLPSRCVQALINAKKGEGKKEELDPILDEIKTLHQEKHKGRELWWLSQAYYLIKDYKNSQECQKLAQDELYRKAERIRDEKIKQDYLELPPLHKQIFMKMEDIPLVRKPSNDEDKEESINSDEPSIFKFCPSCGFNNENLFKFCPGCGNSLIS